jgi:hypothetical protein
MRPLFYEWPAAGAVADVDDQFMLGPHLMVAPALVPEANATARPAILPATDRWYDATTGVEILAAKGGVHPVPPPIDRGAPAWWRGGGVVALAERARRSTAAASNDPLTLVIAPDGDGNACGDLYLDDGASFAFARGAYSSRRICWAGASHTLTNAAAPREVGAPAPRAAYDPRVEVGRVVILGQPASSLKTPWTATAGEASPGPLTLAPGAPVAGVVVKKPGLAAAGDWSIKVAPA